MVEVVMRREPFDGSGAQALLAAFNAEIAGLYAEWTPTAGPSATPEDFAPPDGTFVVAYGRDRPVACGGLKRLDARTAEIKRLFVVGDARGRGLGRRLLDTLEAAARAAGYELVRLDTGDRQPDALRLFRTAGYREIADYNGNRFARYWFEKPLS